MKKRTKILLTLLFIMLVAIAEIYIISQKTKAENSQANDLINAGENNVQEDSINIADCSEEFMENYFEKSKELKENFIRISAQQEKAIFEYWGENIGNEFTDQDIWEQTRKVINNI